MLAVLLTAACVPASHCNAGKLPRAQGPCLALMQKWIIIRTHRAAQGEKLFPNEGYYPERTWANAFKKAIPRGCLIHISALLAEISAKKPYFVPSFP